MSFTMTTLWVLFQAIPVETFLFLAAVVAYFALFGNMVPHRSKVDKLKSKQFSVGGDPGNSSGSPPSSVDNLAAIEHSFKIAAEAGDHKTVLKLWNRLKRYQLPSISLVPVVEGMLRFKRDHHFIVRELKAFLCNFASELDVSCLNDVLELVAKSWNSDLMNRIAELIHQVGFEWDPRTYEIFLSMYFTSRQFDDVQKLSADMKANNVKFTTRASTTLIKTALKTNDFELARQSFRELKDLWTQSTSTPSSAPRHILSQIVDLACQEHRLWELLPAFEGIPITEVVVNTMLTECAWQRDVSLTKVVEKLVYEQHAVLSDRSYSLLLKSFINDEANARRVLDELLARERIMSSELALASIAACARLQDLRRADALREKLTSMQVPVLSAFIRFYVDRECFDKACDLYEQEVDSCNAKDEKQIHLSLEPRLQRVLMNAALRCGRSKLASNLLSSSPLDVAKHITMIRTFASQGNLDGAISVFETLKSNLPELNSIIYNTIIDACVECQNISAAEAWMQRAKDVGMSDIVSYNTIIKAHLARSRLDNARKVMEEIKQAGLQPNLVTFNELINAVVAKDDRAGVWSLVAEMQKVGIRPNQVTCSILLKNLNAKSTEADVLKTMDTIGDIEGGMDEVLLSSVLEACVRIGKPELVSEKLQKLGGKTGQESVAVCGAHTYGSLIKAYGFAKDLHGVWRCWKEMWSRRIRPTSVTLGCMVAAIVNNGDSEGALELVHQMCEDDRCREIVNSVIYCSILKGFSRERNVERAWSVYEEMQAKKIEISIVAYNTLIDACARCSSMDRVASLLEDMAKLNIRPNVITYSTMIKGHCQAQDLQAAFSLLKHLKAESNLKPDEIMYNSLLDGCAQNGLVDEGLRVLEEMQEEGICPSNYTLSVLVKLMSRARQLDTAFELVEKISSKYKLSLNVHVYTNLTQACITNKAIGRGLTTLEEMVKHNVSPESRSYNILIRACTHQCLHADVEGLIRGALALPGAPRSLSLPTAACYDLDRIVLNEALAGLVDCKEIAVPLLADITRMRPKVRIEKVTQRRAMATAEEMPDEGDIARTMPMRALRSAAPRPRIREAANCSSREKTTALKGPSRWIS